ncbi:MAG TPA: hypothetical protein VM261_19325 [Kofleriaceae bacterium]|nr:hypothetical protein [Kofleriaceae bacterium]
MLLYVEIVSASAPRRGPREPCFIDPQLPLWILTSPELLDAERQGRAGNCRVWHVEGNRFLAENCIADAGVSELDTLVLVQSAGAA